MEGKRKRKREREREEREKEGRDSERRILEGKFLKRFEEKIVKNG